MVRALAQRGRGSQAVDVRMLQQGTRASTYAVRVEPAGWVVLKRWHSGGPDLATMEFQRLRLATRLAIRTPEPIELDATGTWFGSPALVMSHLPGRRAWHEEPGPWIAQLAEVLTTIHDGAVPTDVPGLLRAPHAGLEWTPQSPDRLPRTRRVERLLAAVRTLQDDCRATPPAVVLLHHDFHQPNVLWQRGKVSAVVDWHDARLGPRVSDVAYCTIDLARTSGIRAAKMFTDAYVELSGPLDDLPRWQALWIASQLPFMSQWPVGGGPDNPWLTRILMKRRLTAFADQVLSRL